MPVADGEAQVVFHAPAGDDAVLVVIMVGERVAARRAFVADGVDEAKIVWRGGIHDLISFVKSAKPHSVARPAVKLAERAEFGMKIIGVL